MKPARLSNYRYYFRQRLMLLALLSVLAVLRRLQTRRSSTVSSVQCRLFEPDLISEDSGT